MGRQGLQPRYSVGVGKNIRAQLADLCYLFEIMRIDSDMTNFSQHARMHGQERLFFMLFFYCLNPEFSLNHPSETAFHLWVS